MANFVLKFPNFRYHGNKGRSLLNLNGPLNCESLKTPLVAKFFRCISCINDVIPNFVVQIIKFGKGPRSMVAHACVPLSINLLKECLLVPCSACTYVLATFQISWSLIHKRRHNIVHIRWTPDTGDRWFYIRSNSAMHCIGHTVNNTGRTTKV